VLQRKSLVISALVQRERTGRMEEGTVERVVEETVLIVRGWKVGRRKKERVARREMGVGMIIQRVRMTTYISWWRLCRTLSEIPRPLPAAPPTI
jgi:hypothetical protein